MSSRADMNKMGKHIAELRKKKGYTQKRLGDLIDVSDKTISKWEKGVVAPDITILNSLASTLDITVEELLLGENKQDLDTVEAINIYSKITKRNLLKYFIILCLVVALCVFFVFRIEEYYSWHIDMLQSNGKVFSSGYILSNNKESKIIIKEMAIDDSAFENFDIENIKSLEFKIIYDGNIIYSEKNNYDNFGLLRKILDNYVIYTEENKKIVKENLVILLDAIDKNSDERQIEITYK